jgi:hypothetical protein
MWYNSIRIGVSCLKRKVIILLFICGLILITGCGKDTNKTNDSKLYNINGISIKLDREDFRESLRFKTSTSFVVDYNSTTTTYTIYKDENKDRYDLSNLKFRLDVYVDTMNTESTIDKEIQFVQNNDHFQNIVQEKRRINDKTWEYFSVDNYYDDTNVFQEHIYISERKINDFYFMYKIYFSCAEDIEEFEREFMNSIQYE